MKRFFKKGNGTIIEANANHDIKSLVAKSFLHNDDKIVGTSGDADGNLAEDVQDWITSQDAELVATTNLNVTCTQFGSKIFTLVVLDSD